MTDKFFTPKRYSLPIALLLMALAGYACAGAAIPTSTQAPSTSSTEEPPLGPLRTEAVSITQTSPTSTLEPSSSDSQEPVIPETRRLTLEYPSKMKAGLDTDIVRLTLEVDSLGNITPTAEFSGNVVTGDVISIPNLYDTHFVTAEAELDLAGMLVEPPGSVLEPLRPGQSVTFHWSIRPQEAGRYRGTVWLHLIFANKTTKEESRIALSAQVIEIQAVDFFGLSANFARTSGVVGSVIGGIVGFPFLDDIIKYLFGRRKKNSKK